MASGSSFASEGRGGVGEGRRRRASSRGVEGGQGASSRVDVEGRRRRSSSKGVVEGRRGWVVEGRSAATARATVRHR
eukprot:7012152-Pyramimonas_sp.AAC.1